MPESCLLRSDGLPDKSGTVSKEQIDEWTKYRDGLKPIEIGDSGQIKEWYDETEFGQTANGAIPSFDAKHRHMSHLLGVYPGDLVTVQNASDQTKTAQLDAVIAASGQDVKTYPAARYL